MIDMSDHGIDVKKVISSHVPVKSGHVDVPEGPKVQVEGVPVFKDGKFVKAV